VRCCTSAEKCSRHLQNSRTTRVFFDASCLQDGLSIPGFDLLQGVILWMHCGNDGNFRTSALYRSGKLRPGMLPDLGHPAWLLLRPIFLHVRPPQIGANPAQRSGQIRRQPALGVFLRNAAPRAHIVQLVFTDFADTEVFGVRMGKVKA
jgi:hypothetical protein